MTTFVDRNLSKLRTDDVRELVLVLQDVLRQMLAKLTELDGRAADAAKAQAFLDQRVSDLENS